MKNERPIYMARELDNADDRCHVFTGINVTNIR